MKPFSYRVSPSSSYNTIQQRTLTSLWQSNKGRNTESYWNSPIYLHGKEFKHLRQESQKPGDTWLLDYAIMNQTTEDREQETVALVILDVYSTLVRVIPCKKCGNVLPHILTSSTRSLFGSTNQNNPMWQHSRVYRREEIPVNYLSSNEPSRPLSSTNTSSSYAGTDRKLHPSSERKKKKNKIPEGYSRSILTRPCKNVWSDPQFHGSSSVNCRWRGYTSPISVAKSTNIKYDPALLLQPPGCMVHVSLTKDHAAVEDSSLGSRVFEGIFYGNGHSSPLVRA